MFVFFFFFLCMKLGLQSWERFAINWQKSIFFFLWTVLPFLLLLFTPVIYWAWFLWISVFEIGSRDSSHLKLILHFSLCPDSIFHSWGFMAAPFPSSTCCLSSTIPTATAIMLVSSASEQCWAGSTNKFCRRGRIANLVPRTALQPGSCGIFGHCLLIINLIISTFALLLFCYIIFFVTIICCVFF